MQVASIGTRRTMFRSRSTPCWRHRCASKARSGQWMCGAENDAKVAFSAVGCGGDHAIAAGGGGACGHTVAFVEVVLVGFVRVDQLVSVVDRGCKRGEIGIFRSAQLHVELVLICRLGDLRKLKCRGVGFVHRANGIVKA